MSVQSGTPASRRATGLAAIVTVVVAVAADVIAGGHPLHTATLGLVALVVAVMRHRLAGCHVGMFAVVRGAVVAQPALHAAMKLLPDAADPGSTLLGHSAADTSTTAVHLVAAAAIVAGVAGSEQLFLAVATLQPFTRWLRLLACGAARPRFPSAPVPEPPAVSAKRLANLATVSRRGPPAPALTAA
jgi:hypothetical protein